MESIEKFLFERIPYGWFPQTAFAKKNKCALAWFPGRKHQTDFTFAQAQKKASYAGFSQLAFPEKYTPEQRKCVICWVGIDIDSHDNPDGIPEILLDKGSTRKSTGGSGVHVLFRLENPIVTDTSTANRAIKAITAPYVNILEKQGVHVCKADRRIFWLTGGKQEWLKKTDEFINPVVDFETRIQTKECKVEGVSENIQGWLNWFYQKGLATPGKNLVYIGDCVRELRNKGEKVYTKSRMSGNGEANGYLDISKNKISLWAWADGHSIWVWEDIVEELKELI